MRAKQVTTGVLLAALVGAIFLLSQPGTKGLPAAPVASSLGTTITIDPAVGETFAPALGPVLPNLTAGQAWAQFAELNGSSVTEIPAEVSVSIGLLTLPVGRTEANGPIVYTAEDELAYGFSWSSCPPSMLDAPSATDNACTEWLFLDADTGEQIDQTWQQ